MTVNDGKLMNVVLQDEKSNEFKKKEKKVLKCSFLTRSFVRSRVLPSAGTLACHFEQQHTSVLAEWPMCCSNVYKML